MRRKRFKDEQLVEPIQACSVEVDGVPYTFNPGKARLKADHPAVKAAPQLFRALDPEANASAS